MQVLRACMFYVGVRAGFVFGAHACFAFDVRVGFVFGVRAGFVFDVHACFVFDVRVCFVFGMRAGFALA